MRTRICTKCKIEKPLECFSPVKNKAKTNKDGVASKCKKCRAEENLAWHYKNRQKSIENRRAWGEKNKERVSVYSKKYAEENRCINYLRTAEWNRLNKPKKAQNASKKRLAEISATPFWLTPIQKAQIQEFYEIASAKTMQTGVVHHVDHIHPIQGKGFNGLHVPWNLQILTAKENVSKKNKLPKSELDVFW